MPVFDSFAVVNALARSLGLESDGAASRKTVGGMPVTRISSTDSNSTAVDAREVQMQSPKKVDEASQVEVAEIVSIEDAEQVTCEQEDIHAETAQTTIDESKTEDCTTGLQVREGMIEPLGVAAPATYADATNLAGQFPNLKEKILALPLSPKKSECPAVHTSEKPNWALAPDKPSPREGRSQGTGVRRGRGRPAGRGGSDAYSSRPVVRKTPPKTRVDKGNSKTSRHQSRSRTPSRGPRKVSNTPRERAASGGAIIAPSSTYICLPAGSSVVVGDNHFPPNMGSVPNPAEVEALIRKLQVSREVGEGGSIRASSTRACPPDKISLPSVERAPLDVSTARPHTTERPARPMWLAGQDGVLRPDFALNNSAPATPDKPAYVVSLPPSQVNSATSSRQGTPSPRQVAIQTVNDLLEKSRQCNRSHSPFSTPKQIEKGKEASSQVTSPLREVTTAPASSNVDSSSVDPTSIGFPPASKPSVKLPCASNAPRDAPKRFKKPQPASTAGPDVFEVKPKERWPTLEEILAEQAKSTPTSDK